MRRKLEGALRTYGPNQRISFHSFPTLATVLFTAQFVLQSIQFPWNSTLSRSFLQYFHFHTTSPSANISVSRMDWFREHRRSLPHALHLLISLWFPAILLSPTRSVQSVQCRFLFPVHLLSWSSYQLPLPFSFCSICSSCVHFSFSPKCSCLPSFHLKPICLLQSTDPYFIFLPSFQNQSIRLADHHFSTSYYMPDDL